MIDGGIYDGPNGRIHGSGREVSEPIRIRESPGPVRTELKGGGFKLSFPKVEPPPAFDWADLGVQLRECADTMHGGPGNTPSVGLAYRFLLENAACFVTQAELDVMNEGRTEPLTLEDVKIGNVEWPASMPTEPNIELIAGYYLAS